MRILLHRLLERPRVRVIAREGDVTRLRVEGLVCDAVCARRTASALRGVDGVRDVRVDFASGTAEVVGPPAAEAAYDPAVQRVVAFGFARRWFAAVARTGGRRVAA